MKQCINNKQPNTRIKEAIVLIKDWKKLNRRTYLNEQSSIDSILYILEKTLAIPFREEEESYDYDYDVISWLNGKESEFNLLFSNSYL